MSSYTGATAIQRSFVLALPLLVATWFVTVPALLTTSSFLALGGILAGAGWVIRTTCLDAQPASSLAQSMHDAEHTTSPARAAAIR